MNQSKFKNALQVLALIGICVFIGYKIVFVPKRVEMVAYVLLISLVPVLKYYNIGIYMIFILTPFIPLFRRLYYLIYARPETDVFILVPDVILMYTLIGFLFAEREDREANPTVRKMKILCILYFLFMLLHVFLFNQLPVHKAFLEFKYYGPFVLSFLLGAFAARNTKMIKRLGIITLVIGVFTGLYGIKQLHVGFNEAENLWLNSISFQSLYIGNLARPFSTFSAPADYADYQTILMIVAVAVIMLSKKKWVRVLMVVFIVIGIYSQLVTSVRSSWVGTIAGVLVWFLVLRKQGQKNRWIGMVMILSGFVAFIVISGMNQSAERNRISTRALSSQNLKSEQDVIDLLVKQRMTAVTNPLSEHSMHSRIMQWGIAWRKATRSLIGAFFGTGLGSFPVDSLYFTYLAEFGFPGLIMILYINVFFILKGMQNYDRLRDPFLLGICRGVLTLNFIFLTINTTGSHIHSFPGDLYYWFSNGVMLKLPDLDEGLQQELKPGQSMSANLLNL